MKDNTKTDLVVLRISPEMKKYLEWKAGTFGLSMSAYVRRWILSEAREDYPELRPDTSPPPDIFNTGGVDE